MPIIGDCLQRTSKINAGPRSGCKLLRVERLEDRALLSLMGLSLFPADNPWNQKIDQAPAAANSTAIISAIVGKYGNGRLHPDFGQDFRAANPLYGIPYNVVHGNSVAKIQVVIDAYPSESDIQNAPVPASAVIEGDQQNGPTVGVNNRGDSHLIVWDEDNDVAYEFYRASRPSENTDGKWHADAEAVWDMKTDTFRPIGWTSVDAAGLAILPGLVRPDEGLPVSEGGQGVINHAIRFTLQNAVILNQFLYPASHTANPGNTNATVQPPMGARFRLKASVDISTLNPESRVIAQAMKDYGMIVADNGSNFFFSGASYSVDANNQFARTWNDSDVQDTVHGLKSLTFSQFEVVDLTPVVSGLSATSGPSGTPVTVIGQNFSGAAGRLNVLFGSSPASSVTIVDDRHLLVTVPAGSGTVDVRVLSGVSDPSDPSNIKSPVYGYGLSSVSSADRFIYSPKAAIAGFNAAGQWWVGPSSGSGFTFQAWGSWNPAAGWQDVQVADVNGDGKADIVGMTSAGQWWAAINTGTGFVNQAWGGWNPNVGWQDVNATDVNGDGKADIVGRTASGDWYVALSMGTGFLNQYWGNWNPNAGWQDVYVADVNGDGKADIVGMTSSGGWYVAQSTGTSFVNQNWGGWNPNAGWTNVRIADVNGDGKSDVVGMTSSGGWYVAQSTGTSFVNQYWGGWNPSAGWANVRIADANGDGKADVVGMTSSGDWYVALSTGTGFVNQYWTTWNPTVGWTNVRIADVNGDGKADIVGTTSAGQWWAAISTGTGFANQYWGNWDPNANWPTVLVGPFA
jgi:hypothetical protein